MECHSVVTCGRFALSCVDVGILTMSDYDVGGIGGGLGGLGCILGCLHALLTVCKSKRCFEPGLVLLWTHLSSLEKHKESTLTVHGAQGRGHIPAGLCIHAYYPKEL